MCTAHTVCGELPDPKCSQPEPKFLCGSLRELGKRGRCQVWSIGSAGETCMEEVVHAHAPGCTIHVFDPTVSADEPHIANLVKRGVIQFHPWGLGARDEKKSFTHYGKRASRKATSLRLVSMMEKLGVDWIDYLKIDW